MIHRFLTAAFAALILAAVLAGAAPYPNHADLYVNDLADALDPAAIDRLRGALAKLKTETGVEMTVLTIASRGDYDDSASIEAFATGLFNAWGIGRKPFNDGILVLIAVEDREMRLELGSGYDQGYDVLAQDIVNRWFLPEFKNGNIAAGIAAGTTEAITRIARRHAEGLPAEAASTANRRWSDRVFPWVFWVFVGGIVGMGLFGRRLSDWSYRFRRCPQCGQKGLHRAHLIPPDATPQTGQILTTCRNCDYRDQQPWRIAQGGKDSGGSFGGGRSSGGGASGRW